jgi:hypothetical protein
MTKGDTKILEMLIGQMAKNRKIDIVIREDLSILGHPELLEPVRDLLHRVTMFGRVFGRGNKEFIPIRSRSRISRAPTVAAWVFANYACVLDLRPKMCELWLKWASGHVLLWHSLGPGQRPSR